MRTACHGSISPGSGGETAPDAGKARGLRLNGLAVMPKFGSKVTPCVKAGVHAPAQAAQRRKG
jgi:hypothetical protein